MLKREQQGSVTKSIGFVKSLEVDNVGHDSRLDSSYEPFLMEGLSSFTGKATEQVNMKMLRDTGTTQSFVVAGVLPFSENNYCGSNVLVQGIEMNNNSSTTTQNTGAPQGGVLSLLLFMLLTHDCTAKFSSNHIIKFTDDTSVVVLISKNDETQRGRGTAG